MICKFDLLVLVMMFGQNMFVFFHFGSTFLFNCSLLGEKKKPFMYITVYQKQPFISSSGSLAKT